MSIQMLLMCVGETLDINGDRAILCQTPVYLNTPTALP